MRDTDPYLMRCALRLAGAGMAVFPLRPNTKVPALGRGWQARATCDQEQIRSWWSALPFNIGVPTGDGLIVVDLDAPKATGEPHGRLNLIRLAAEVGEQVPRDTFTVVTGRGGQHLYFRVPANAGLRNTAGLLAPRVDSRADGVVAAVGVSSRACVLIEALRVTTWRARSSPVCVSFPGDADPEGATLGGLRR